MTKQELDLLKFAESQNLKEELDLLTQSAKKCHDLCPRKYFWRYEKGIVPDAPEADYLRMGTYFHKLLELFETGTPKEAVLAYLDDKYKERAFDTTMEMTQEFCRLKAMFLAYHAKYAESDKKLFRIASTEEVINKPLVNPRSKRKSRSFRFSGKVDGVWATRQPHEGMIEGQYFLAEHKTARSASIGYMKTKAEMDLQVALYCHFLGLSHCMYNVVIKPSKKIKLIKPYTLKQEYKKNGEPKKNLTKIYELDENEQPIERFQTEDEYLQELLDWYAEDSETKLFRLWLTVTDEQKERALLSLWQTSQRILSDKRDDFFMQNPDGCEKFNRFCDYYPICSSNDNPIIIENQYKTKKAHSELDEEVKK